MENLERIKKDILFLVEKLINGIFSEKVESMIKAVSIIEKYEDIRTPKDVKARMCWQCSKELAACVGCEENFNRCPSCNASLDRDSGEEFTFCPDCGQALKWMKN